MHARVWDLLDAVQRRELEEGKDLSVSIVYSERPIGRSRAAFADACEPAAAVSYGRIRDATQIVVSTSDGEQCGCDECCAGCEDPAVLLARVKQICPPGQTISFEVDVAVRRMLARQRLTTVTGISFVHGGVYGRDDSEALLSNGLWIRFSCPVRTDTISPGVVELIGYEGGRGRRDEWYYKQVVLEPQSHPLTTELRVLVKDPEVFQEGDQVLLRLRSDFVLDECCRAVDGNHVGGAVPFYEPRALPNTRPVQHPVPPSRPCPHPPGHTGQWSSGNGTEGGTFEAWFFVREQTDTGYSATGPAQSSQPHPEVGT
jgi:hypothetical protein